MEKNITRNITSTVLSIMFCLFLVACINNQKKIALDNFSNGDKLELGTVRLISGTASRKVKSISIYINEKLQKTIKVDTGIFSFKLKFKKIGDFKLKLSDDNSNDNLIVDFKVIPTVTNKPGQQVWKNFNYKSPIDYKNATNLRLWATNYYTPVIKEKTSGKYYLRAMNNKSLGVKVSLRQWCDIAMEGSVLIEKLNSKFETYNYAGTTSQNRINCKRYYRHDTSKTKFKISRGKYGEGVRKYNLVPFRTIATDPRYIPYGSLVFIPSAVGEIITLPTGEKRVHDGYFFSADTGGLIKKNHIDVYTGISKKKIFNFIKNSSKQTFKAYIIKKSAIQNEIKGFHYSL